MTDNTFLIEVTRLAEELHAHWDDYTTSMSIPSMFGDLPLWFGEDDQDDEYVRVILQLPKDVYAEIDDGTFGELQGFRVYR